jgi:hypothetical protein
MYLEIPPFVISKPVCELTDDFPNFTHAGISFFFLNQSDKDISNVTASFMLFDARTKTNPFVGTNLFEIQKYVSISPDENKQIVLSLDRVIYVAPIEPYLINNFYISGIEYADGSIWKDKYGVYITGD